jgi:predicted ATP-dependent endonuclease of OLD family
MRIDQIEIRNFRGIRELTLDNLGSTIVIAGANGSGKSCIFDAIRLLKSAYGGYQQNEWHHWMAEFQINYQTNAESFYSFFQDKTKELSIRCRFRFHQNERDYLKRNGEELVRQSVWRIIAPELYAWSSYRAAPFAAQYRDREPEVQARTKTQWEEMLRELAGDTVEGRIWAHSGNNIQLANSKALEILFSSHMPGQLGVIDYHGAQRMYTREQVSAVSLDLTAQEQQNKNHALYNYNSKYGNVKSEMAASYVKELLAKEAGVPTPALSALSATLDELFKSFFPDKKFLGLRPTVDGALTFPVQTSSGTIHDLNELSAGEKEVLFGYLRIRNSAPRYSIILIDEPELHLNPRLVHGLPKFYHEHLGTTLEHRTC